MKYIVTVVVAVISMLGVLAAKHAYEDHVLIHQMVPVVVQMQQALQQAQALMEQQQKKAPAKTGDAQPAK